MLNQNIIIRDSGLDNTPSSKLQTTFLDAVREVYNTSKSSPFIKKATIFFKKPYDCAFVGPYVNFIIKFPEGSERILKYEWIRQLGLGTDPSCLSVDDWVASINRPCDGLDGLVLIYAKTLLQEMEKSQKNILIHFPEATQPLTGTADSV